MALVDQVGTTQLAYRYRGIEGAAEGTALGATVASNDDGTLLVTMSEAGDGPAVVLLPKDSS